MAPSDPQNTNHGLSRSIYQGSIYQELGFHNQHLLELDMDIQKP
jgi:hypothetical protein